MSLWHFGDRFLFECHKVAERPSSGQVDLVICGLFICEFEYMQLEIEHFSGIPQLIVILDHVKCKFNICKPNFLVPIYRT